MIWTNEKPKAPGWYWYRVHALDAGPILFMYEYPIFVDDLTVELATGPIRLNSLHGQFAGPIKVPA